MGILQTFYTFEHFILDPSGGDMSPPVWGLRLVALDAGQTFGTDEASVS
jgi:hypothetical protein